MYKKYIELYNEYNFDSNIDDLHKINEFNKEKIERFNLKNELNDAKKRIKRYVKNNIIDKDTEMECCIFINSIVERKTTDETFKRMIIQRYEIFEIDHNNHTMITQAITQTIFQNSFYKDKQKNKTTIKFEKYSDSEGSELLDITLANSSEPSYKIHIS